jgi:hypothetical protein
MWYINNAARHFTSDKETQLADIAAVTRRSGITESGAFEDWKSAKK